MEFKRVVITGVGTVNPLGNSVDEFWENLKLLMVLLFHTIM